MYARTNAPEAAPDAPIVVLVHGMVISSSYMAPAAERLAPLSRVYAVDLPGYGKSYKPWPVLKLPQLAEALATWMNASALPQAHLVANSFGCQILAEFALHYPQRIDRLVFQGPTVDAAARTFWRQFVRLLINGRREPVSLGWISLKDYAAAGLRRAWATLKIVLEDKIEEKLPYIQAPTLVVCGSRDTVAPQRWAQEVARLLPHGSLQVIPGAAHTLNYSAPEEFVQAIRPFLRL